MTTGDKDWRPRRYFEKLRKYARLETVNIGTVWL